MIEYRQTHPLLSFRQEGAECHLDVRELLDSGEEPFMYIMDCVEQVGPGDTLVIHALFEPLPLIQHVRRMGLTADSTHTDMEHWELRVTAAAAEG